MENTSTMCINVSQEDKETFEKMAESQGITHRDLFEKYQENYLANQEENDSDTKLYLGYNAADPEGREDEGFINSRLSLGYLRR
ncbi:hypothetical protein JCM14036_09040 [Desulfotomaculum defluvii]